MTNMVRTFSALADPTRLGVVETLMQRGEMPVADLMDGVEMSAPAMSRHLKVLREAGVVTQRAEGTKRYYSVAPESMRAIAADAEAWRFPVHLSQPAPDHSIQKTGT